ncbi:MAG: hypothetical protein DWQ44_07315 [Bacteroidetes bacterium]|nr:MAG: hypothetical protein DWQ33_12370 [Bacteroidota bacterium]REJ99823.1 MAG: hypothetical protein DWQ39_12935 [Bacteroidota bacterium]REK34196.1 MAG: hypothetical protein DWQ44_07315 [Bacteroidota bacterium]REK50526.1 MAG: hypothetical protein DWQ48_04225 [Bacteroidota bacterium]
MRKYIQIASLLIILCIPTEEAYSGTPVLLFLSRQDQPDSLGYNIVEELANLVHREIMDDRVVLWDSPQKETRIHPETLKKIEASSGDLFINARQLFIYEFWNLKRKNSDLNTLGFYFSNRSRNGNEIAYGYVDYNELADLLANSPVPSNANGSCSISFQEVFANKSYFYNVIQIGEKKVTNVKEAISLKEEVNELIKTKVSGLQHDCKRIEYVIEYPEVSTGESTMKAGLFLNNLQMFLNENREEFYNFGGDRIYSFHQPVYIVVNSATVTEEWRNTEAGIIQEFISMRIYVQNSPMNEIDSNDLSRLNFITDFKALPDFLSEKEFYFRISKINDQNIDQDDSAVYLKALQKWKWNELTEYVKYE